jgi:tRNA pseudouridine55 synthase
MATNRGRGPPDSVLVVDKPRGPTSHDVVARLRRALRTRAVGHCGTLDPMATGVLVVAVEEGTKLVPWLTADDKAYEATIRLGVSTDSLDADGVETARAPIGDELAQALGAVAPGERHPLIARALGVERLRTQQMPPVISAIRIGGERAYEIARRGEEVLLSLRDTSVRRLDIVGGGLEPEPHLRVVVEAAKGYFVRSLARDLAEGLGTVGHLTALRRIRSGAFTIEDAIALDSDPELLRAALLPIAKAAARALPTSILTAEGVIAAGHGQRLMPGQVSEPHLSPSAWLDEAGALMAIGQVDEDGSGRVLRGFPRSSS